MNNATLLFRQINPSWIREGRVTSQAFTPTKKDEQKLSVYDGDQISAEASWRHFTSAPERKSIGVMAVTVKECRDAGTQVMPDPDAFQEHVVINFASLTGSQAKDVGKNLAHLARGRDWQYRRLDQSTG